MRPLEILRMYWETVLVIEENAEWIEPEYREAA
jgi:hypothetical protein